MGKQKTARSIFIASVLAATPAQFSYPAVAGALTGACSTGTGGVSQVLTLSGEARLDGLIDGEIYSVDGYDLENGIPTLANGYL